MKPSRIFLSSRFSTVHFHFFDSLVVHDTAPSKRRRTSLCRCISNEIPTPISLSSTKKGANHETL